MHGLTAMILCCVLAAALPLAASAQAPASGSAPLQTQGWEAVGRLDIDGKRFCTGSLIARDVVLTAAHCLYDRDSGARVAPERITFRAGLRDGAALAERSAVVAVHPPRYVFGGAGATRASPYDLALLKLSAPVGIEVQPFAVMRGAATGDSVGIVSYARGRSEAASLQEVCAVLGREEELVVLSCEVDFGASGAPVFRLDGETPRLVSIVSAKAEMEGQPVAVGVALDETLQALMVQLSPADPGTLVAGLPAPQSPTDGAQDAAAPLPEGLVSSFRSLAPASVRVLRAGERSDTGARWVRP
ncbi:trypsin-like serine peptidase [Pseudoroseicyclus aestuarii]|uniref:V8-like Glu-specific endopeptidase n=1 Tax=Pseudoroseicyclus aestuarii TaxID=1795041 RepID=A0A318SQZ0_9RHOB|nr:trypsin-like peptidase domain-containing protein [Pseudoroseicyclus aestuarii]PYE83825.1 V8-like Glu-specific endopeptidase [Pseudoroseicyclus aestuarii]